MLTMCDAMAACNSASDIMNQKRLRFISYISATVVLVFLGITVLSSRADIKAQVCFLCCIPFVKV